MNIWIIISYIQHANNLANGSDADYTYPLYRNSLVAVHPIILVTALTLIMLKNDIEMLNLNLSVGDISGKLGIIRIYYILINAIIMGGI
jgi:hypothetical protein